MNDLLNKDAVEVRHPDPIHEYDGKWYFWDETWADKIGPYETRGEAEEALELYACAL